MKIMLWGVIAETVLFIFFVRFVLFSDNGSYGAAATALAANLHAEIKPELMTEQFINELRGANFKPVPIQKTKRAPFSVKGVTIALGGDNIQVFEYPDHATATKEGMAFAQKYTGEDVKNRWKSSMHIYVKDKIVVFYMGKDENILASLNKDMNSLSLSGQ